MRNCKDGANLGESAHERPVQILDIIARLRYRVEGARDVSENRETRVSQKNQSLCSG